MKIAYYRHEMRRPAQATVCLAEHGGQEDSGFRTLGRGFSH